jgi:hypothetical protein
MRVAVAAQETLHRKHAHGVVQFLGCRHIDTLIGHRRQAKVLPSGARVMQVKGPR